MNLEDRILMALQKSEEFHKYEVEKYREVISSLMKEKQRVREALVLLVQKGSYMGGITPQDLEKARHALRYEE